MGRDAEAKLAYGIVIDTDSNNVIFDGPEENGSPAELWQAYPLPTSGVLPIATSDGENPIVVLCLAETLSTADRCRPQPVQDGKFTAPENAAETLVEYCKKWNLKTEGAPGWLLCAYYG